MRTAVRVRVPATSANLGPAFDCAGLALSLFDHLEFAVTEGGLDVRVDGVGAGELPCDETHLVVRAFRAACDELGWHPPGLRIAARNGVPQGRGLGSSAAAVVAGIRAAWALCPDVEDTDLDAVLDLATTLEGHPDNVGACLLGGLTLTWTTDGGVGADRLDVDAEVLPVVLVPETTLSTHAARGLLPATVPHADAAANAGRAAVLVHALTSEPALLLAGTEDRLHQRQREPGMPESLALMDRLREAGHAAVVSGAGPSLLVLSRWHADESRDDPALAVRVAEIGGLAPKGWRVLPLAVDQGGARVDPVRPQVSSA